MARVIGFRGPAGKNNVFGLCVDEAGNLFPRPIDGIFGLPPKGVRAAGGIAKAVFEIGQHRLDHPFIHRRGGVVVEIYGQLDGHFSSHLIWRARGPVPTTNGAGHWPILRQLLNRDRALRRGSALQSPRR